MVIFIGATQQAPVSVPLSEIASVKIRRFGFMKTALALGGLFCVGYAALAAIMLGD